MNNDELIHYGVKGQKWGVRRYQNKDGSYKPGATGRYDSDGSESKKKKDEYDEERERHEQEVAKRRGVEYVRKTKKEREAEDAEEERKDRERRAKEDDAYKKTEDRMKKVDEKLKSKYKFDSDDDYDKYYKEYDEEWFKILYEERKKKGLSHADMSADELYHYGIKGQKWGRRRFQNSDGSLTAAGRARYGTEEKFNKYYEKDISREAAGLKIYKFQAEDAKKSVESIKTIKQTERVEQMKRDLDADIREKVYKMSDEDLKAAVNRMNMEERYTQVMKDRTNIEVGRTKTEKFLDYTAAALSATTTALTVAILMKELQK